MRMLCALILPDPEMQKRQQYKKLACDPSPEPCQDFNYFFFSKPEKKRLHQTRKIEFSRQEFNAVNPLMVPSKQPFHYDLLLVGVLIFALFFLWQPQASCSILGPAGIVLSSRQEI